MFAALMVGVLVLGVPLVAFATLRFSDALLMKRIPESDMAKIRTDIYSMRAAYASFLVSLAVICLWAVAVTIVGSMAAINWLLR
jgi:hypothetical protein